MVQTVPRSQVVSRVWSPLVAALLLVLAAFAAYHNSFSGPFVYDDIAAIRENPTIRNLSQLSAVLNPPSDSGITVNGRPLVNLTLAVNYAFGETDVAGYHVLNLIIHILAGLALFGLVRRSLQLPSLQPMFGSGDAALPLALCIALLWTLHPLQTESVTYVVQRAESLAGLFYLLTLYCFVRAVTSPNRTLWRVLTVTSCLLGMASKEVMASAPLLVLLYDRAFVSGTFRAAWQRHARLYLGLAATWILLAWLVHGTGSRGGTAGFGAGGVSSWHYALTSALAIGKYLKLSFWPSPLVFDYGTAVETELLPVLPQGIMIVALVLATAYALWRRPMLGFLGLWFFAILGPSSSIIPIATETLAEHRMYLPLAAVVTLVVLGTAVRFGRGSAWGFLLLALGAGVVTARRNEDYRDEMVLWRDTQQKYPTNARAHNNVGEILFRQKKQTEAIASFREAVRLLPNYVDAINNLGNSLTQAGQTSEALEHLQRARQLKPDYAATLNNLATTLYRMGRREEAVEFYREALRLKPNSADIHNNLGVVLSELGNPQEAAAHHAEALRLKPNYSDAHYNYGNALNLLGRPAEAVEQFNAALRLAPDHAESHNNLASILFNQGKIDEARRHYEAAIRLKPDYPDANNNLGAVLFQIGRANEALTYIETAIRLKPDYADARQNLAKIAESYNNAGADFFRQGKVEEARQNFAAAVRIKPDHASARNNLGVALWRSGRLKEALSQLEEAVRLKPNYQEAIDSLAAVKAELAASPAKP